MNSSPILFSKKGNTMTPPYPQRIPRRQFLQTVSKNEIRETRGRASRIGILIGAETRDIRSEDNQIDGFATSISDLRKE
jgi:hypothetical protein